MKEYRRICADIDLDALTHNLDEIHRCIRKETKIIAVVKADGYGHGAVPLAEVMEKTGRMSGVTQSQRRKKRRNCIRTESKNRF